MTILSSQWVVIDAKIYNLSRFKDLHPGGISVLTDDEVGTSAFHMLYNVVVLTKSIPQPVKMLQRYSMGCIDMKFWSDHNINAFRLVLLKANSL
jgi:hypothetical protein